MPLLGAVSEAVVAVGEAELEDEGEALALSGLLRATVTAARALTITILRRCTRSISLRLFVAPTSETHDNGQVKTVNSLY